MIEEAVHIRLTYGADGLEDCFFVGEISIEGAEAEVRSGGDVSDRGRFKAAFFEQTTGGRDQTVTITRPAPLDTRN